MELLPRILLRRRADGWTADFIDDSHVLDLFGTTEIPTPFLAIADPEMVRSEISARNPGYLVDVDLVAS